MITAERTVPKPSALPTSRTDSPEVTKTNRLVDPAQERHDPVPTEER
jgi:hypothetical protein